MYLTVYYILKKKKKKINGNPPVNNDFAVSFILLRWQTTNVYECYLPIGFVKLPDD